jgi:hypothetical protein
MNTILLVKTAFLKKADFPDNLEEFSAQQLLTFCYEVQKLENKIDPALFHLVLEDLYYEAQRRMEIHE